MSVFMINCGPVKDASENIKSVSDKLRTVFSSVNGYDVSCDDDFDFSKAKSVISNNVSAISSKINGTSIVIANVVTAHKTLQKALKIDTESSNEEENNNSDVDNSSNNNDSYSSDEGYYSNGSSYSGNTRSYNKSKSTKKSFVKGGSVAGTIAGKKIVDDSNITDDKKLNKVTKIKVNSDVEKVIENGFDRDQIITDTDGYMKYEDKYLISCDKDYGEVGSSLVIHKKDGSDLNCIIGINNDESQVGEVSFLVNPVKWDSNNTNNFTTTLLNDIESITPVKTTDNLDSVNNNIDSLDTSVVDEIDNEKYEFNI